jgi:hypothetical protein
MTEIQKILLASGSTVVAGVIVFVAGQLLVKFVLEPIQELRRLIGAIAHSLAFYANQTFVQGPKHDEAMETYRQQACKLREALELIPSPFYALARCCKMLPSKKNVIQASGDLIGLSNVDGQKKNTREHKEIIEKLLRIQNY